MRGFTNVSFYLFCLFVYFEPVFHLSCDPVANCDATQEFGDLIFLVSPLKHSAFIKVLSNLDTSWSGEAFLLPQRFPFLSLTFFLSSFPHLNLSSLLLIHAFHSVMPNSPRIPNLFVTSIFSLFGSYFHSYSSCIIRSCPFVFTWAVHPT